jgi:hypothetical protein
MMTDKAQLLFIKILLVLAHFDNKMTKSEVVLIELLRCDWEIGIFRGALQEVRKNFPKLKCNKYFYYMDGFAEYTNYIPNTDKLGKSHGSPKDALDIDVDVDKDKERDRPKANAHITDSVFIETLKNNTAYAGIDIDKEFGKMDAYLMTRPGHKKTRRFVVAWLNRIDKPIKIAKKPFTSPKKDCEKCNGIGYVYDQNNICRGKCSCVTEG